MSNKELLENAAKAAGINGSYVEDDDWYGTGIVYTDPDDCNQCWNPLTDDGDALRTEVKLKATIFQATTCVIAELDSDCDEQPVHKKEYCDDETRASATRRAIVRAAAEIGKQMS